MARVSFVSGVVVAILVGLVLNLVGVTNAFTTLSIILLMAGVWTIVYGLAYESDRVFWIGWGAGVAILASIALLPLAYTVALILIVVIALIIFSTVRPKERAGTQSVANR